MLCVLKSVALLYNFRFLFKCKPDSKSFAVASLRKMPQLNCTSDVHKEVLVLVITSVHEDYLK